MFNVITQTRQLSEVFLFIYLFFANFFFFYTFQDRFQVISSFGIFFFFLSQGKQNLQISAFSQLLKASAFCDHRSSDILVLVSGGHQAVPLATLDIPFFGFAAYRTLSNST